MTPNLEGTLSRARLVWRDQARNVHVSFPTLPRAFEALSRLSDSGRVAEYDAYAAHRHWIRFGPQVVMPFALV